jgi:GcrA cell cycle regulator
MQAFSWTELAIAAARDSYELGLSPKKTAADLSRAFGGRLSRNAVIGKWFRMGLTRNGKSTASRRAPWPKRVVARETGMRRRKIPSPSIVAAPADAAAIARAPHVPVAQRKQLLDLGPSDCRWPIGDPKEADFFFCGRPQVNGSSYCRRHDHIATTLRPRRTNGG